MKLPLVAIVGRPNVGKSSLLNCIVRSPVAIVDDTPGTTRDRVEVTVRHGKRAFRLVDTGGMGIVDRDDLEAEVERQIGIAVTEADLVLFVADVREGVLPLDDEAASRLRTLDKHVVPVVNKCDTGTLESAASAFFSLGFGEPLAVSAKEGFGRVELMDRIIAELPETGAIVDMSKAIKVAVVGKRNAGKSTLINCLVGSERVITSIIPGTTRDAVDVPFEVGRRRFIAIDTAGVHKRGGVTENVDFYSSVRTERSIRRADVVLLLIDASVDISRVDKQLAGALVEACRPVIVVINKWDVARERGIEPEAYAQYIGGNLTGLSFAPISFMSAKEGFNVVETLAVVESLHRQAHTRVPTAEVNRVVEDAVARRRPPMRNNQQLKVFYATQTDVVPPTLVIFVNDREAMTANYERYLANAFRAALPFAEVPIKIELRNRRRSPSKRDHDGYRYTEKMARKKPRPRPKPKGKRKHK